MIEEICFRVDNLHPLFKETFNRLREVSRLQICYPTGTGKGYLMITDILYRFFVEDEDTIVILTHRLSLNEQHLKDMLRVLGSSVSNLGIMSIGTGTEGFRPHDNLVPKGMDLPYDEIDIPRGEIYRGTINQNMIEETYNTFTEKGKKKLIISTYHSAMKIAQSGINIDTIYCDEAHKLVASDVTRQSFMDNYRLLNAKNRIFTTATPRVSPEESNIPILSMSDEEMFGERVYITLGKARDEKMITDIKVIITHPEGYLDDVNYISPENKKKIILSSMDNMRERLIEDGGMLAPKLLVKMGEIADIYSVVECMLSDEDNAYNIAFCSSSGGYNLVGPAFGYDKPERVGRNDFFNQVASLKEDEELFLFHVDILTEGINVEGLTGVIFMNKKVTSISNFLQNLGRITRLNSLDRDYILSELANGVKRNDIELLIKKNCYVYLPFFDPFSTDRTIKGRDIIAEALYGEGIMADIVMWDDENESTKVENENGNSPDVSRRAKAISAMIETALDMQDVYRTYILKQSEKEKSVERNEERLEMGEKLFDMLKL